MADLTGDLLERSDAIARMGHLVSAAKCGQGGLMVIDGDPGQGKTALLRQVGLAIGGGMELHTAQGGELEQSLPWGVTRQLMAVESRELTAWESPVDDPVTVCFALTDRLAEMAEQYPVLLIVDDAHWSDPLSVRWLIHLAARISEMPVAAVVSARPHDPRQPAELVLLRGVDGVEVHRLVPLTAEATSALVRRHLPPASDELCRGCHEASGGNALLVVELARELASTGAIPTPEGIAEVAIDRIDRVVARRLAGVEIDAAALARAAAVCGARAVPADVAAVAGLAEGPAVAAADALRGIGLIEARSGHLAFTHPLLRAAVERSIPAGARTLLHIAAAHRLDDQGEAADRVASHLLIAEPGSDSWARARLMAAGAMALGAGAPAQALAYYQRALAERTARDPELLLALGRAAMGIDPAGAEAPLRAALAIWSEPEQRAVVALELAVVLQTLRRYGESVALLESLAAELRALHCERGLRLRVEAELLSQSFFDPGSRQKREARLEHAAEEIKGEDAEEALLLVQLGVRAINFGTADEVVDLTDRAWGSGALAELVPSPVSPSVLWIPYLYMYADKPAEALAIADNWIVQARLRGSAVMTGFAEAVRAEALLRSGRLVDALGAAEVAWAVATELGPDFPGWWMAAGAVAQEMLAIGDAQGALQFLERAGFLDGPPQEIMLLPCPRVIRAECLIAAGNNGRGIAELEAAAEWLDEMHEPSPGAWHYPALLVDGLLFVGRRDRAAEVAEEWLARTENFGARTTIGMAQRSVALTRVGEEQIDGLVVAERTMASSPSCSEHARSLIELGSALRRAGRRLESRQPLREGLAEASTCGAQALASRAVQELAAAGARPRRVALTGAESLSPAERRVAQLAASGLTNREIAATLFLSRKTIEHHLGSIYTKLGTNDRSRLATL